MAFKPAFLEGFEENYINFMSPSGNVTTQGATVHSGSYAARFAPSSGFASISSGTIGFNASSMYVYFDSLPSKDCAIHQIAQISGIDHRVFIGINASTGKWRLGERLSGGTIYYGADGPSVATGEWIMLQLGPHTTSGTTHYTSGYINDVALDPSANPEGVAANLGTLLIGTSSSLYPGNADTFTFYVDDITHWYYGPAQRPELPFPDYQIERLYPVSDGTHSNGSSFTDNSSNSPPSVVYSRVDDFPPSSSDADYVSQTTIGTGDYLEVNFSDSSFTAGTQILGVQGRNSRRNNSGTQVSNLQVGIYDPGVSQFFGIAGNFISSSWQFNRTMIRDHDSYADFTIDDVNNLTGRIGYSSDVTPVPQSGWISLQVAGYLYTVNQYSKNNSIDAYLYNPDPEPAEASTVSSYSALWEGQNWWS